MTQFDQNSNPSAATGNPPASDTTTIFHFPPKKDWIDEIVVDTIHEEFGSSPEDFFFAFLEKEINSLSAESYRQYHNGEITAQNLEEKLAEFNFTPQDYQHFLEEAHRQARKTVILAVIAYLSGIISLILAGLTIYGSLKGWTTLAVACGIIAVPLALYWFGFKVWLNSD